MNDPGNWRATREDVALAAIRLADRALWLAYSQEDRTEASESHPDIPDGEKVEDEEREVDTVRAPRFELLSLELK